MTSGNRGGGTAGSVLVVHADGGALDRLTRFLERAGYRAHVAATNMTADAQMDTQDIDCVVCGWEASRAAPLFARAVSRSPLLAERFVFYGYEAPETYYRATGSRGTVIDASAPDAVELLLDAVAVAVGELGDEETLIMAPRHGREATTLGGAGLEDLDDVLDGVLHDDKPTARGEAIDALVESLDATAAEARAEADRAATVGDVDVEELSELSAEFELVETDMPTLLVVDDEPLELRAMERFLADFGFAVTGADGYQVALERLTTDDFDVILSDWFMHDGSGPDILRWLSDHKPHLVKRMVFVSGTEPKDLATAAPGRPFFPKGQDSAKLMRQLVELCRRQNKPVPVGAGTRI